MYKFSQEIAQIVSYECKSNIYGFNEKTTRAIDHCVTLLCDLHVLINTNNNTLRIIMRISRTVSLNIRIGLGIGQYWLKQNFGRTVCRRETIVVVVGRRNNEMMEY